MSVPVRTLSTWLTSESSRPCGRGPARHLQAFISNITRSWQNKIQSPDTVKNRTMKQENEKRQGSLPWCSLLEANAAVAPGLVFLGLRTFPQSDWVLIAKLVPSSHQVVFSELSHECCLTVTRTSSPCVLISVPVFMVILSLEYIP